VQVQCRRSRPADYDELKLKPRPSTSAGSQYAEIAVAPVDYDFGEVNDKPNYDAVPAQTNSSNMQYTSVDVMHL
jgi:hypothetical protein